MKFKVGDRVRILKAQNNWSGHSKYVGHIGTIQGVKDTHYSIAVPGVGVGSCGYHYKDFPSPSACLELVTKGGDMTKPYERKTYRQLKESVNVKKGGLYQERCDDGTQPYDLVNADTHLKGSKNPGKHYLASRELIEDQPQFFEEVFKVHPGYMTREELDQWEAFNARKKPGRKPVTVQQSVETRVRRKKRGETARRSAAMKAAWARRKAAQAA